MSTRVFIGCYRGKSAISRTIQFRSWSVYSHVAAIYGDGSVVEAWHKGGVVYRDNYDEGHADGTVIDLFHYDMKATERRRFDEFLEDQIARSQIVKTDPSKSGTIIFGSCVKVLDLEDGTEEEFTLVGAAEADPSRCNISIQSPIGSSLLGKSKDDIVEIETPGGLLKLKILDFS